MGNKKQDENTRDIFLLSGAFVSSRYFWWEPLCAPAVSMEGKEGKHSCIMLASRNVLFHFIVRHIVVILSHKHWVATYDTVRQSHKWHEDALCNTKLGLQYPAHNIRMACWYSKCDMIYKIIAGQKFSYTVSDFPMWYDVSSVFMPWAKVGWARNQFTFLVNECWISYVLCK